MPFGLGFFATAGGAAGSYELIASEILTSSQASVTFSNLGDYSSTYKHLQIRAVARTARAANGDTGNIYLNGVTTSTYARHYLQGNGSTVSSDAVTSQTDMNNIFVLPGANATANAFAGIVIDLLDVYATKNKTVRSMSGLYGGDTIVRFGSGLWNSTNSLTSVTLDAIGDFAQYSRFSLYGIKGA